jgi:hemerythrin-like metal-binding protein
MENDYGWKECFSVNVPLLDDQHKELFKAMAQLDFAVRSSSDVHDSTVTTILEHLIQHTINHFVAEEDVMAKCEFPNLAAHQREHREMVQKLATFNLSHMAGKRDVAPALLRFLQEHWREHILKADREYGEFLKQKRQRRSLSRLFDPHESVTILRRHVR